MPKIEEFVQNFHTNIRPLVAKYKKTGELTPAEKKELEELVKKVCVSGCCSFLLLIFC